MIGRRSNRRNIGANQIGNRSEVLLLCDDEISENAQFSASILASGPSSALWVKVDFDGS